MNSIFKFSKINIKEFDYKTKKKAKLLNLKILSRFTDSKENATESVEC